ncbi:hypothetical protein WJX72_000873 [[Myrmecia] bisecta]|uniref:Homologous recombination OB-fold protein OB-fold domain-containing protein n=1 Tax=[Myrmecia] bisecta TaxID=41462 RepID=A0AAW1QE34_9CHLO
MGQALDPDFLSAAWLAAMEALDLEEFDESSHLLQSTVKLALRQEASAKIPKLVVLLTCVNLTGCGDAFGLFKDPTGSMGGGIHRSLLEQEASLAPGAVLVLEKVTLLKVAPKLAYLCITGDNIVQVIPADQAMPSRAAQPRAAQPAWGRLTQAATPATSTAAFSPTLPHVDDDTHGLNWPSSTHEQAATAAPPREAAPQSAFDFLGLDFAPEQPPDEPMQATATPSWQPSAAQGLARSAAGGGQPSGMVPSGHMTAPSSTPSSSLGPGMGGMHRWKPPHPAAPAPRMPSGPDACLDDVEDILDGMDEDLKLCGLLSPSQ